LVVAQPVIVINPGVAMGGNRVRAFFNHFVCGTIGSLLRTLGHALYFLFHHRRYTVFAVE
jgi:hypothetical protein